MVNAVKNETPECLGQFAQVLIAWKGVCINEVSSEHPARLLEEVRGSLREFGGVEEATHLLALRVHAKELYDLSSRWGNRLQAKECCDLKLLSCRLRKFVLDKLKPDDAERSSIVHEHRGLCQALCHTATAYQCQVNDLDAANDACELAVALIATAEKSSEYDSEGLAIIKLDLLFRQLEVSQARCDGEDYSAAFTLLEEARKIIKTTETMAKKDEQSSAMMSTRKFGILTFNFALLELKKHTHSGFMAAKQWATAAAELFADCGTDQMVNHAQALTITGKAIMQSGIDVKEALPKLLMAYELRPDRPIAIGALLIQCLILMEKWEGGNTDSVMGVLLSDVCQEAYTASTDKAATCRGWMALINQVVEARRFDYSCQLFDRLLSILTPGDDDESINWENAHVAWIAALVSQFSDLQKEEEVVDKMITDSAERGFSQTTQRKMLKMCFLKVKDLDNSGRGQRAIEWRKRALEFAGAEDQNLIRRQIAKNALRLGDLETAKSYMQMLGEDGLDNKVVLLQIAAKSGNAEDTRRQLDEICMKNEGTSTIEIAEAISIACQAAYENGFRDIACDGLERMIQVVILGSSPHDMALDVDVDKLLQEYLIFMALKIEEATKKDAQDKSKRLDTFISLINIFETLLSRLHSKKVSQLEDATLSEISNHLQNSALLLYSICYENKTEQPFIYETCHLELLELTGKLFQLSGQYMLLLSLTSQTDESKDDARESLFQSASCNVIVNRNICPSDRRSSEGKLRLMQALGCLERLSEIREVSHGSQCNDAEFLMTFEVVLELQKDEVYLDKMVKAYLQHATPGAPFLLRAVRLCMSQQCVITTAAVKCVHRLLDCCLLVMKKDNSEEAWKTRADIHIMRLELDVQHHEGRPFEIWANTHEAIKESQGKFPPEHIQSVSAQSHNKGVSAFYFGRKVEAEQFLALAYTLSTLTNLVDPLVADAIKKAYDAVLG